jgi:transposase InsO family protein
MLSQHGFICSMSGKGNCYNNAVMESFYHTLKVELVYGQRYRTRKDAQIAMPIILRYSTIGSGSTQASITRLQRLLRGLLKLGVQFFETRS